MSDCNRHLMLWPCENTTPGHTQHFVSDLSGKTQAVHDAAFDELIAAMDEKEDHA